MIIVLSSVCEGTLTDLVSPIGKNPITYYHYSQDMVLCRRYRGLERRIARDGETDGLKCQVKYWVGAWEVEEIFTKL